MHITISYVQTIKEKKLECYLTVHNIAAVIKQFSFSSSESSMLNVYSHINYTVYDTENILRFLHFNHLLLGSAFAPSVP